MALKIYTEDEDGNAVGEIKGEEHVDYRQVKADWDEELKGQLTFEEWLRSILMYLLGGSMFISGVREIVNGGSVTDALKFFGITAVAIWWYFDNRKKRKR